MNPISLRKNFSWTLVSNAVYGGYQWALLAIIAKMAGASTVGQFSLALALVTPVQMFFNLQLRAIQASDTSYRFPFATYFTLRTVTSLFSVVVVLMLSGVWPLDVDGRQAVFGVLIIKSFESLSDVIYGAFQQAERMDVSSRSRILESLSAITAFFLIFTLTSNLLLALLGIAVALIAILIFYTIPRLTHLSSTAEKLQLWHLNGSQLTALFHLALPLGITMGLINANGALPRLILSAFRSDFEVGIFAGFMQLMVAGMIIIAALGQAVTPTLARYFNTERRDQFFRLLNRLTGAAILIGVCATLGAWLIGKPVVTLLYTDEYARHTNALVVLAAASGFTFAASFQGYGLTAARIIRPQMLMIVSVTVTTLIILMIAVPRYGLVGASLSVLCASVVQVIYSSALLRMKIR